MSEKFTFTNIISTLCHFKWKVSVVVIKCSLSYQSLFCYKSLNHYACLRRPCKISFVQRLHPQTLQSHCLIGQRSNKSAAYVFGQESWLCKGSFLITCSSNNAANKSWSHMSLQINRSIPFYICQAHLKHFARHQLPSLRSSPGVFLYNVSVLCKLPFFLPCAVFPPLDLCPPPLICGDVSWNHWERKTSQSPAAVLLCALMSHRLMGLWCECQRDRKERQEIDSMCDSVWEKEEGRKKKDNICVKVTVYSD